MDIYNRILDLCTNRRHLRWICPLLLLAESALCALIIWKVPYTEIDWTTYMQQISLFLSGERDYTHIEGSTGPLVYPAAHVYIYSAFYHATDEGRDIGLGQVIFAALYLTTLAIVMKCYRYANAPPYIFGLLVLSKRLHSIFLLRMFNDAVATLFMWAAIYTFQRRQWTSGVLLWTVGVGVKMTLLLIAPAIAIVLTLAAGLPKALQLGVTALLVQVLLAIPFLQQNATGYISNSFQFARQFLFKWTVNWRFVGEQLFLSKTFSLLLLASHVILLVVCAAVIWIRPSGKGLMQLIRENVQGKRIKYNVPSSTISRTILESLFIGLLYARSLHYQFFAYIAWASPFLLWRSGTHPLVTFAICIAQEWAWNVYPSTDASSIVVVASLWLQLVGSFWGELSEISRPTQISKEHVQ